MQDIRMAFLLAHWLDSVRGNDALAQLFHVVADDDAPQFGLTDKKYLQEGVALELEIRQDAEHLEGGGSKRLCLIHH
jgi:hypothetical protein